MRYDLILYGTDYLSQVLQDVERRHTLNLHAGLLCPRFLIGIERLGEDFCRCIHVAVLIHNVA